MILFETADVSENVIASIDIKDNTILLVLSENQTFSLKTKSPEVIKNFKEFLKKNPAIAGSAITLGTDSLAAYQINKNQTARLYAQNPYERKVYGDIVDILNKSGKFKIVKRWINNSLMYELIRK